MLHTMIRQSERDAVLQFFYGKLAGFSEHDGPVARKSEHIAVDRFERVNQ